MFDMRKENIIFLFFIFFIIACKNNEINVLDEDIMSVYTDYTGYDNNGDLYSCRTRITENSSLNFSDLSRIFSRTNTNPLQIYTSAGEKKTTPTNYYWSGHVFSFSITYDKPTYIYKIRLRFSNSSVFTQSSGGVSNSNIYYKISCLDENGGSDYSRDRRKRNYFDGNNDLDFNEAILCDYYVTKLYIHVEVEVNATANLTSITDFYNLEILKTPDPSQMHYYFNEIKRIGDEPFEETPLKFINSQQEIKNVALVKPNSLIASPLRVKINPDGQFARNLLGSNNDGIVAIANYMPPS